MAMYPQINGLPWQKSGQSPTRVAIIGDIILDEYLDGSVSRISPEAPVPVHLVGSEHVACGGAGNVALNVKKAGGEPILFGVCGQDDAGAKLLKALESNDISTDFIIAAEKRPTTRKTRIRASQQQLLRIDWELTCAIPNEVQVSLLESVSNAEFDVILISDYGKGGLSDEMIAKLVKLAEARGVPTIVDPKGKDFSRYQGVSLITPNRKEALEAIGEDAASGLPREQLAAQLQERWQLQNILVTLGSEGMLLKRAKDAGDDVYLPTEAREVYDVSGAGDTVVAIVALCLGANSPFERAIKLANAAAGIVVQKWGTQPVYADELLKSLREKQGPITSGAKVVSRELAKQFVCVKKAEGKQVVFSNGCFDILHAGHVEYLEKARSMGDLLVIGLNSDQSVRNIKGQARPIVAEQNRARLIAALGFVDLVVLFDQDTPEELIKELSPNILVKGADWQVESIAGAGHVLGDGGEVKTIDLVPGLSTTGIIEKVIETYQT